MTTQNNTEAARWPLLSLPSINIRQGIPTEVIAEIVRRIAVQFHPHKIILFGSYAYGQPRPDSDVDLMVIMDTPDPVEQVAAIAAAVNTDFGWDLLVYTPAGFQYWLKEGFSFIRKIAEEGKVLYEADNSYLGTAS